MSTHYKRLELILLTNLEKIKNYLNIRDQQHDKVLENHIQAVTNVIEHYCRRKFNYEKIEEVLDGSGQDKILLSRRPVEKIEAVYQDLNRAFGEETLIDKQAYVVYQNSGILLLVRGCFYREPQAVKIKYWAGYKAIPPALTQAANILTAHYFVRGKQGGDGVSSESIGAYTVSYDDSDWPASAKTLLNEFRDINI